jgi:Mg-chelatase subunit ChlD
MNQRGGGTDLAKALGEAQAVAEQFLSSAPLESVPHSAVIVVMSDGIEPV